MEIVDSARFERVLVRALEGASPVAGLFGPDSLSWRVDREAALFLGGARAALLQLAHPWVAAAIDDHSSVTADPLRRFRGTFTTVFCMVFGTTDQAASVARRLHRLHGSIQGVVHASAGEERYFANQPAALEWVAATLTDTALQMFELVLGELGTSDRERYYAESKRFAALFGLEEAELPPDWPAFQARFAAACEERVGDVTDTARRLGTFVLRGLRPGRIRLPIPDWYQALTLSSLPAPLREAFSFPFGAGHARAAERAVAQVRRWYPRLPDRLRYVPPYLEALRRLEGEPADVSLRTLNRLWFGRPTLVG